MRIRKLLYQDEAVRDRLVCGISSKATRQKLLGEVELSLEKAVDITVGMEFIITN